jgi:periplasmic divalent cation tolerance protein
VEYIAVWVTAAKVEDAEMIARALLDQRLAACCNIMNGVRSLYRWEGKIVDEPEVLVVIKSRAELFEKIKGTVTAMHGYTVPEIIAFPVVNGSEPYLRWIDAGVT